MKRKKSKATAVAVSMEDECDLPNVCYHCDELAPVIEELTRQIHLLGVIIDELVSEFQWQNNQIAEQIRGTSDFAESLMPDAMEPSLNPIRHRRKTLFE